MTAEQFVKKHYPNARCEKQKTNGGESYYLIRDGRNTMYMASGKTKSNAWSNAKKTIKPINT